MKNTLIYQSSNYDCGPTTLTNAVRYLFQREEIHPILLKQIWSMGLDAFSPSGVAGKAGTSKASMRYMSAWLNDYARQCQFPVHAHYLEAEQAIWSPDGEIRRCLLQGGCAVIRCWLEGVGHYVLLTCLLTQDTIGLFDPYDEVTDQGDPNIRFVSDRPKQLNRAIRAEILNGHEPSDYAMGTPEEREALLLWRTDSERVIQPDKQ